ASSWKAGVYPAHTTIDPATTLLSMRPYRRKTPPPAPAHKGRGNATSLQPGDACGHSRSYEILPFSACVSLDGFFVANACVLGIHSELAPRPTLAEQVPALVQSALNVIQARAVCLGRGAVRLALEQRMLLARQLVDGIGHFAVVHALSPLRSRSIRRF